MILGSLPIGLGAQFINDRQCSSVMHNSAVLQENHVRLSRFKLSHSLGSGASGFVLSATEKVSGRPVAIKCVRKDCVPLGSWMRDRQLGVVTREIFFLSRISHSAIIDFIEHCEDEKFIYIIMGRLAETCNSTNNTVATPKSSRQASTCSDLFDFIGNTPNISESIIKIIFTQICEAVLYLHANNIAHNDLKDENIIINDHLQVKIVDFGSCGYIDDTKPEHSNYFCGTIQYASPEVIRRQPYKGMELDIWSLGILLHVIAQGRAPFRTSDDILALNFVSPYNERSEHLNDLIRLILQADPCLRPSVEMIMEHEFLAF